MASEVEVGKDVKVTIKPIKRPSWLPPGHDGAFRYTGTEVHISPQTDAQTGVLNTGLTEEDERRLEKAMNLAVGTLNRYNKDYWGNFKTGNVRLPKDGKVLDLTIPRHELEYKLLKVNTLIAKSEMEIADSPGALYVLSSPEAEAKVQNLKDKSERDAAKIYGQLTTKEKLDILKVYSLLEGKKTGRLTKDASEDMIDTSLYKKVKNDPEEFCRVAKDAKLKTMIFIDDLVSARILLQSGGKYTIVGSTDPIGITLEDSIEYLENPRNQDVYLSLQGKLKAIK